MAAATMATQAAVEQQQADLRAAKGPASAPRVSTDAAVPPNSFLDALWDSPTGKAGLGGLVILLLGYAGFKVRQKRKERDDAATLRDETIAGQGMREPAILDGDQAADDLNGFLGSQDTTTTRGTAPQDPWESVFESFETHMKLGDDAGADRILRTAEESSDPAVMMRAAKARARLDGYA